MAMTIRPISAADSFARREMDALLRQEGIRLDNNLDYSCGLYDEEEELLATGSCFGNTIRCLAVAGHCRSQGLLVQVVSHLLTIQAQRGNLQVFLYTKPENLSFFTGLGFYEIARSEEAVFLENRRDGFGKFCAGLRRQPGEKIAAVVMNANPFTLGHRHLVEQAAKDNDVVHLFLLSQEAGPIPFRVRRQLVEAGIRGIPNVVLQETGPYLISSATFPSYFLKETDDVIRAQAQLDLAVFGKIASVLNIRRRYVGTETGSHVTALYNQEMGRCLPDLGIAFREIPRLETGGEIISASTVRKAIQEGKLETVADMLPESTRAFFESPEGMPVVEAIRREKDVIHY